MTENVRLFGVAGQDRLRASKVAIVGVGGLGTHVAQQLALLGVGGIGLIDLEELDRTNFNRYVCVRHNDPVPGTRKVDAAERLVHSIDPTISVTKVFDSLVSVAAFALVKNADYAFGCLDSEGMRLVLTELCAAYSRPYFDLRRQLTERAETHVCIPRHFFDLFGGSSSQTCYRTLQRLRY